MHYDYLIAGAGLFGATVARELTDAGKKVLVVEKRNHIGGNAYTEEVDGVMVHRYGAHIFHTNDNEVWAFLNRFVTFNRYTNSPVALYRGELFSLPFNMYTFHQMWGVTRPEDARRIIAEQVKEAGIDEPSNLEEQAISLVGTDIYEKLIRGYTEKQWGRPCKELPAFIIRRLPVRFTYDNNYFNARHQGIPEEGYTVLTERLLEGSEVRLNTDYLACREELDAMADTVLFTGPIDAFFGRCFGKLEYRSLRFETELLDTDNYQGNAVVNYTDSDVPWIRSIEHKWFMFGKDRQGNDIPGTVVTKEFSVPWKDGCEPYYPVNDEKNNELYRRYRKLADGQKVLFGGRLGSYQYYDMDQVVARGLALARQLLNGSVSCADGRIRAEDIFSVEAVREPERTASGTGREGHP